MLSCKEISAMKLRRGLVLRTVSDTSTKWMEKQCNVHNLLNQKISITSPNTLLPQRTFL